MLIFFAFLFSDAVVARVLEVFWKFIVDLLSAEKDFAVDFDCLFFDFAANDILFNVLIDNIL